MLVPGGGTETATVNLDESQCGDTRDALAKPCTPRCSTTSSPG